MQDTLQAFDVHRFGKDILHHFADQRVIGNVDIARHEIFGACLLLWEYGRQQIIGAHTLNIRWNFLAAAEAKQGQRPPRIPAPPCREQRRCEHSLLKNRANGIRMKKMKNVCKRKTMLLAQ